jgi:hypothetical protein
VRFVETYHKWNKSSVTMPGGAVIQQQKGGNGSSPGWGGSQPWMSLGQ